MSSCSCYFHVQICCCCQIFCRGTDAENPLVYHLFPKNWNPLSYLWELLPGAGVDLCLSCLGRYSVSSGGLSATLSIPKPIKYFLISRVPLSMCLVFYLSEFNPISVEFMIKISCFFRMFYSILSDLIAPCFWILEKIDEVTYQCWRCFIILNAVSIIGIGILCEKH